MALLNTDLFIVERSGVQYKMTAEQIADFVGAVRDYTVADIPTRNALTGLNEGDRVFVTNAIGDATVDSGWAVYRFGGTNYEKIQEQESMDLAITADTNLGVALTGASVTITNDTGTDAVIPLADGTNAGLMSPTQFNDQHVPAVTGLTTASNPINITPATQELTFGITQLTALP